MSSKSVHPQTINYIKKYRKADQILNSWNNFKKHLIKTLITDPYYFVNNLWTDPYLININSRCYSQAHTSSIPKPLRNSYNCANCLLLGRILDFNKHNIQDPFVIEHGKMSNTELILKQQKPISVISAISLNQNTYLRNLIQNTDYLSCDSTLDDSETIYIGCDNFTEAMLINLILENVFKKYKVNIHVPKLYNFYICGNIGNSIFEHSTIGDIQDLSKIHSLLNNNPDQIITSPNNPIFSGETILGIISQILLIYKLLQDYKFTHGSPNLKSLTFFEESISYIYEGVNIYSFFTLKLTNLGNSGITITRDGQDSIRLYSSSTLAQRNVTLTNYKPNIKKKNGEAPMYQYDNVREFLKFFRHSGIPVYTGSFDTVGFLISLMSYKPFYQGFYMYNSFVEIWKNLWLPEDLKKIEYSLSRYHSNNTSITKTSDIALILSKKWIRCDALTYLWESFKKINISEKIDMPL